MQKIQQLNETMRKETALAIEELVEFPDGLITVAWADCDPNFSSAKIGISVLPDRLAGTALEKLRARSGDIAKALNKRMRFRKVPKLLWVFDSSEKNAAKLNTAFDEMEKKENLSDEEIDKLEDVKYE